MNTGSALKMVVFLEADDRKFWRLLLVVLFGG
jgi:uncharacterized protein